MTPEEFEGALKALGLTPAKPSYNGATLHRDKDGDFYSIPNASELSPSERSDFIELLMERMGVQKN